MRVCLLTEGTYPYVRGGVSTWCHDLIAGLPEIEFTIFALVGNPSGRLEYTLPPNVTRLVSVPLWGHERLAEYNAPDLGGGRRSRSRDALRAEFIPLFREFLDQTGRGTEHGEPHRLVEITGDLYRYFREHDYDWTMRREETWNAALEHFRGQAWHARFMSSLESIELVRSLYRYLIPLAIELPPADVYHSSLAGLCGISAIAVKAVRGTPVLLTEHGVYLRERVLALARAGFPFSDRAIKKNLFSAVARGTYAVSDVIAPVCTYNTRWEAFYGVPADRVRVVYNGVDETRFVDRDPVAERPTVAAVLRIDPLKDVPTMIASAVTARARIPNVEYKIWGPAPDAEYLALCEALIDELDLRETVKLMGPTRDPASAYAEGHVCALSSISEGFPYSIIEAMMCGRAVVATDVGGVREAIDAYGTVVPPKARRAAGRSARRSARGSAARPRDRARRARLRARELHAVDLPRPVPRALRGTRRVGGARVINVPPPSGGGFDAIELREARVEAAARSVVAAARGDAYGRGWRPKGVDEVAILLESLGYSADVVAELWYPSLFAFAADVARTVDKYVSDDERGEQPDTGWFARTCRDYAVGALYSGPWIIAVIGLAVCGASLWSSLSTPPQLATTIALGVYGALVVSGIFSQAIARRLTFYYLQDNAPLMLWTLERFIGAAAIAYAVLGVAGYGALRAVYGDLDALVAAAFFVGSGLFQTSLAPLYTMRKFWWITGLAALTVALSGGTFVLAFHRIVDVPWEPLVLATEIGLVGLIVIIATLVWMKRLAERTAGLGAVVPPAPRAVLAGAIPYAIYGACYFFSIVVDHLAAGLVEGTPFRYRPGYELGCDIALLAIIPVVGVINVVLEDLPRRILSGAAHRIAAGVPFDRAMTRFYLLAAGAVFAAAALTVGLAEVLGVWVLHHTVLGLRGAAGGEAEFVLRYAAIGYGLLMLALLNAQILFFLSRPRAAVAGAGAGAATVTVASALLLALHQPAASMVYALDLGVLVFVLVTTLEALGVMRRFTFAYYAAY